MTSLGDVLAEMPEMHSHCFYRMRSGAFVFLGGSDLEVVAKIDGVYFDAAEIHAQAQLTLFTRALIAAFEAHVKWSSDPNYNPDRIAGFRKGARP